MPSNGNVQRKLAAIMFTDIAGYTESMSVDERTAIEAVRKKRSIIQPLIKDYNGVFVKEIGDGTLSYFSSAIDASTCAVKLQETTYDEDHLNLRVGLHIGDIVFDGEDVFGEGVNIASRLESLSPVGGVCVSKTVYDELENKREFNGESLGLQTLKGVGRLIEVYALKGDKLKAPDKSRYKSTKIEKHTDDEVPSIAIIPFKNKGADEDVFYAYGISADLITECSSAGLIRVASLNNIEKIENYQNIQAEEIADKLDVRYTAEGMLWKMGNMFQLSIELYDTKEQKVVWSDRWQENWENLPNIKSNLSDGLLKALDTKPKVEKKTETANPEAYSFYLEAKHKYAKRENTEDVEIVRGLLKKALELDDNLISAKILLGLTYSDMGDFENAMEHFNSARKQSEQLGDKQGIGSSINGIAMVHNSQGDYDQALKFLTHSLDINEELNDKQGIASNLNEIGIVYWKQGEYEKALENLIRPLEISEELGNKQGIATCSNNIGCVFWEQGNLNQALEYFNRTLEISEELGNKQGIGNAFNNIGIIYKDKGDLDKALDYYKNSLRIREKIGDKRGIGDCFNNIGTIYKDKGDLDKGLEYFKNSLLFREEIGDRSGEGRILYNIGSLFFDKSDYRKSSEFLEKSHIIQKEIGEKQLLLATTVILNLTKKHLGDGFDEKSILNLIKDDEEINYDINFFLFELLEDCSFLESAYSQVKLKADSMDDSLKEKFLNYPMPKQIVEAYHSLKLKAV